MIEFGMVIDALASVFVPVGLAGAVIAVVCAVVAGVALARGAAGLLGGAAGIWIVGGMLSVAASFVGDWTPAIVSVIALAAGLTVGGVLGGVRRRIGAARREGAALTERPWHDTTVKPRASGRRAHPASGRPAPALTTASVRTVAIEHAR